MSIEVAAQRFLFRPGRPRVFHIQPDMRETQDNNGVPWTHNYLHDLESLWWVTVWMITFNDFCTSEKLPTNLSEVENQLMEARNFFPLSLESTTRSYFFTVSSSMMHHNELSLKASTFWFLDRLRQNLLWWYREVESTLPLSVNLDACDDSLYSMFMDAFNTMLQNTPNYSLVFLPGVYEKLRKNLKRPRAESES